MILVSACLAGFNCRYDGKNHFNKDIFEMVQKGEAIPVCPEVMGGLETPRTPVELIPEEEGRYKAIDRQGVDRTKEFVEGAVKCTQLAKAYGITSAILKSKSPSCGFGEIYDGTFTKNLVKGNGITAEMLRKIDVSIYNEFDYLNFKYKK